MIVAIGLELKVFMSIGIIGDILVLIINILLKLSGSNKRSPVLIFVEPESSLPSSSYKSPIKPSNESSKAVSNSEIDIAPSQISLLYRLMFQSKSKVNLRLSNTVPILNPNTRLS